MAKKKETAEQKLLKMIETSSGEGAKAEQKVAKKQDIISIFRSANLVLKVGIIIAALFLFKEVTAGIAKLGEQVTFSVDRSVMQRSISEESLIPLVQELAFYLAEVERRNIFQPYAGKIKVAETDRGRAIARKTDHLRLVGIAWLDTIESASVMLEDTEREITHFLQRGENLGDISVETIYADSVKLGDTNEEIIIRYDKPQN